MKPLFLGGHPALDFLNTLATPRGERLELLGSGAALAAWLESAGLADAASLRKLDLDAAAAEARKLREWARDWIGRWRAAPKAGYDAELRRLNRILEPAKRYGELVRLRGGFELRQRDRVESNDELLALLATQVAGLLASESPELVKRCEGAGCSLWFVDRTKAHGRRFCSAAACGNRAKVAAYRERQREAR
jgi:predicted RNA-binding Zn ribbon-like protein